MEFFSDHYLGHILNRFSEDLLYIDERVPYSLYLGLEAIAEMVGIIILMGTVNGTFLMASLAFCILPLVTSIFCLKIGRALKRLEISTRCSLLGLINATAEGLPTIRSARVENILIQEFDRHQDLYTSASYLYLCWFRALSYIVDICFVIFTTGVIIILLLNDDDISAAHVGFVLSQASLFKRSLDVGFRRITKLETEMTAVERILDYTKQKLEPKSGTVMDGWPQREGIKFSNVYFSYSSADNNVLLNLNFTIGPHKTVAIVGRTGAGKSSIISTILRLHKFQGNISIDGVDITTLPLDNLRSNISVISQDLVLFTGTVRENIDLSGKYQDDDIWNALRTVNLEMLFPDLNYRISSVDVNLSLGQKQLFCLARAIVRKNKIIIMDEVTANLDQGAEAMIHKIVREEFSQCTVIMITHWIIYLNVTK
ncbi:probable multidrug resistance-associated protein lethal(2)03659 [Tenebrio molitor]|uniref:probable multidrug resistance-associated protein lethal(2)03659 n=1 Tax=Tenebrio molitor TaxID=7067 RepID=UPI0036246F3E